MTADRLTVPASECLQVLGVLVHRSVSGRVTGLLSHATGCRLSSGWRSEARNRAVGGVPRSRHLSGCAIDIVGPRGQLSLLAQAATRHGAVEAIYEGDHLHVGWRRPPVLSDPPCA